MKQVAAAIAFFLVIVHTCSSTNSIAPNSPPSLVDGVCKQTENYADCVSALQLNPRTSAASDLKSLARIVLETAIANTTNSKVYFELMTKSKRTAPSLMPTLKNCISSYARTVALFNSTIMELDSDITAATYDALLAYLGSWYCGDSLKSTRLDVPSIKTRVYYLDLYGTIGYRITKQLSG
ncbi:hypothetical protein AB3S75_014136 [Citrus x aurantiifolia]